LSDISKCRGNKCKVKDTCWRYKAPANPHYQSYFNPIVLLGKCNEYWKIEDNPNHCLICNSVNVDKCHIKTKGSGGSNEEFNIIYLCRVHHQEQHKTGIVTFVEKYQQVKDEIEAKGWVIRDLFGRKKLERI
jgi:hypothetical protein